MAYLLISNFRESKNKVIDLIGDDPFIGPENAKVTIIEFYDYACVFCARAEQTLKQILRDYPEVRLVYKDFPVHSEGWKAAEAANCAREQGKFQEYHDILFENQRFLSVRDLKLYAIRLNLNSEQFDSCLDSGKYSEEVKKDYKDGIAVGVSATPTFIIDGERIVGAQSYSVFSDAIERALSKNQ